MKVVLLVLWLVWGATAVAAGITRPLTTASLPTLERQFAGQRHAVLFWSLTCVPCFKELEELGRVPDKQALALVLVNTDVDAEASEVELFLAKYGLTELHNWQFADAIPARLRTAIDPDWYGELPRSYAIAADGKRFAQSGRADIDQLVSWLRGH